MVDLERTANTRRNRVQRPAPQVELDGDHLERLIQLEAEIEILNRYLPDIQQQNQSAIEVMAEANQRLSAHVEENKRVNQRMDEQDSHVHSLRGEILKLEKAILEVKLQLATLLEFTSGIKRVAWVSVSVFGIVLWWFVQKWLEMK